MVISSMALALRRLTSISMARNKATVCVVAVGKLTGIPTVSGCNKIER